MTETRDALIEAARDAASRAYAPYSGFHVGAALLLKNGDVVTGAHLHAAPADTNGPVIFPLPTGPFPATTTLTAMNLIMDTGAGINSMGDAVNAILSQRVYANIHTTVNSGGEIRGGRAPRVERAASAVGQSRRPGPRPRR